MCVEVIASQRWDVFETQCMYKGRMAHSFYMWINVWAASSLNLCDPSLRRAILSATEMSIAHIKLTKRYTNVLFTLLQLLGLNIRTSNVDSQFTHDQGVSLPNIQLQNDVSTTRQIVRTLQVNCPTVTHDALYAHIVLPQNRTRHIWRDVCQADDKVDRSRSCERNAKQYLGQSRQRVIFRDP